MVAVSSLEDMLFYACIVCPSRRYPEIDHELNINHEFNK